MRTTVDHPALPTGWYIERVEHDTHIEFLIFEEGGATWPQTGDPRSALDVTVYKPGPFREAARVSWPSTSDNRPILALALAAALGCAADEALSL